MAKSSDFHLECSHQWWSDASRRPGRWLISMSLEQISMDFLTKGATYWHLGSYFSSRDIKNPRQRELVLTRELAVILHYSSVDFLLVSPAMLRGECDQSLFFLHFPVQRPPSNANEPLVWFTVGFCRMHLSPRPLFFIAIFEFSSQSQKNLASPCLVSCLCISPCEPAPLLHLIPLLHRGWTLC